MLNFLTIRPENARLGEYTSSTLTLNTGPPQRCVLSPLLYTLFTHDCRPVHATNTISKHADDTTVSGMITKDEETAHRDEILNLTAWCSTNNLTWNTKQNKGDCDELQ